MRVVTALLLSLMVAICPPVSAVSHAQSATDTAALQQLKTKITNEIDSRIQTLQQTLENLRTSVISDADQGAETSVTVSESGLKATVVFPTDLKTKSKDVLQKITTELTKMKTKTSSASSLTSAQTLANTLDAQANLAAISNVQAAVMQSVESMTGVFANLKTTANNLQDQITLLKECTAVISNSATGSTDCQGLSVNSGTTVTELQSELDNIGTLMAAVASTLASSIALLDALLVTFTSTLRAIGGMDSLSNLSNLTTPNDMTKMNAAFGDIDGLLLSFTSITSQIDTASMMSTNIQDLLKKLAGQINS